MSETKAIKARFEDGTIKECSIVLDGGPPWKMLFSGVDLRVQEFTCGDMFEALCALREELEKNGVQLLCSGARTDVFPSGMSRDMGGGRKAYITKLGCPALRSDLVDIFDYCDTQSVGSVLDQQAFHEKWVASLRK